MTAWRQVLELAIGDEDLSRLTAIARSRTEPASRVERARMLLGYREDPSFFAVGRVLGVHHQTVQRCVERAAAYGPLTALDDRPRPGREPTITAEAKAWLVDLVSLLKNVIWLEIGSRVKIGMRIFINRMEHLVRWCDLGA